LLLRPPSDRIRCDRPLSQVRATAELMLEHVRGPAVRRDPCGSFSLSAREGCRRARPRTLTP